MMRGRFRALTGRVGRLDRAARARGLILSTLLVAMALAGCTGGSDEVGTGPGPTRTPGNLPGGSVGTDGEGNIVGVVLTAGFEPIHGARVRLLIDGQQAAQEVTDAQGGFGMEGVPAGSHRLDVSASCCRDELVRVVVEKDRTTPVNVRLEAAGAADTQRPYAVLTPWNGFLACGVSAGEFYLSPCTLDASEDRVHALNVTEGLRTFYVRVDWNSETPLLGEELRLQVDAGEDRILAQTEGPSPLEVTINEEDIDDPELAWSTIDGRRELFLHVDAGGLSAAWQQSFSVTIIEFYWRQAPDDFSYDPQ